MRKTRFAFTFLLFTSQFACGVAKAQDETTVPDAFQKLSKASHWRKVSEIPIQFDTHHPQGMIIRENRVFFTTVFVISRVANIGKGYLYETNFEGEMVREREVGEGAMYHPGGIDFDGSNIWVPVAEYRPNSRSIVYRIDPDTFETEEVFRFNDHLGAVAYNREENTLWAVSWGSRRFYTWRVDDEGAVENPDEPKSAVNGSHYVDYQDCHYVGEGFALCGGLNAYTIVQNPQIHFALGGLELVDLGKNRALHQLAVPEWVEPRTVMTRNPFYYELRGRWLRFYFMPEDRSSKIYVYDVR